MPVVFLADDDAALRRLVRLLLVQDGHEVLDVGDGLALTRRLDEAFARGAPPDLILSDHAMPGATGLEVLTALGKRGAWEPFVLMSGALDEALVTEAFRLGADAVLAKPFDGRRLSAVVRAVLERRSGRGFRAS